MSVVAYTHVFAQIGDFAATKAAEYWCNFHGISYGSMQANSPRGLMVGEFDIAKWRNLSRDEISALHGRMTGDARNGPVRVTLFDNCPSIPGVIE